MDPTDFERLIARAQNPRLIPGIYNYCDGRCGRCAFTERCLVFVENREVVAERVGDARLSPPTSRRRSSARSPCSPRSPSAKASI